MKLKIQTINTILYCHKWQETVDFYEMRLGLPVTHRNDWFIEFALTDTAHISIADVRRASIKSSYGAGITLTLRVDDINKAWQSCKDASIRLEPIRDHAWGARVFYVYDPEGHRIEMWMPT